MIKMPTRDLCSICQKPLTAEEWVKRGLLPPWIQTVPGGPKKQLVRVVRAFLERRKRARTSRRRSPARSTTVELTRIEQFIGELRNVLDKGDAVTRAADRAQARSRSHVMFVTVDGATDD